MRGRELGGPKRKGVSGGKKSESKGGGARGLGVGEFFHKGCRGKYKKGE